MAEQYVRYALFQCWSLFSADDSLYAYAFVLLIFSSSIPHWHIHVDVSKSTFKLNIFIIGDKTFFFVFCPNISSTFH